MPAQPQSGILVHLQADAVSERELEPFARILAGAGSLWTAFEAFQQLFKPVPRLP